MFVRMLKTLGWMSSQTKVETRKDVKSETKKESSEEKK